MSVPVLPKLLLPSLPCVAFPAVALSVAASSEFRSEAGLARRAAFGCDLRPAAALTVHASGLRDEIRITADDLEGFKALPPVPFGN